MCFLFAFIHTFLSLCVAAHSCNTSNSTWEESKGSSDWLTSPFHRIAAVLTALNDSVFSFCRRRPAETLSRPSLLHASVFPSVCRLKRSGPQDLGPRSTPKSPRPSLHSVMKALPNTDISSFLHHIIFFTAN